MTKVTVTDKDGASTSQSLSDQVWVYDPSQDYSIPGYNIVDLGTLGGTRTIPNALNNLGEAVGVSTTAADTEHAFLWRDGVLIDINPGGGRVGWPGALNDVGLIAGGASGGQMPMWRHETFTGFVSVPRTEFGSWPVRVSESGDVVLNAEGHEWPDAYLVRDGNSIKLGGLHSWANDMNAHEQVVGAYSVKYIGDLAYENHAFLWEDGVLKDLASFASARCPYDERQCTYSEAYDINERGQIVGWAFNGSINRAALWDATDLVPHDLGFGNGSGRAVAINENGQIAGDNYESGEGFFRDGETVVSFGSLGGGKTHVIAMNERGAVVGTSITASGDVHAFVWTRESGMRDLGTGPFGAPGVGAVVVDINDRGDVIGYAVPCPTNYQGYCSAGWSVRAILWRPK